MLDSPAQQGQALDARTPVWFAVAPLCELLVT